MANYSKNISGYLKTEFICIVLILFVFCGKVYTNGNILEKKISLNVDGALQVALKTIEDSTGFYFSYQTGTIEEDRTLNILCNNEPLITILDKILNDTSLIYKVVGNQIVIYSVFDKTNSIIPVDNKTTGVLLIKGLVIERDQGNPVSFATVGVLKQNHWTVCNADGEFALNIPAGLIDDSIQIACIGYKESLISIKDYIQKPCAIELVTDYISIQEVVIRKLDPLKMLKTAADNIGNNYTNYPFRYTGFYRESIQKNNGFIAVNEAIVEGYKSDYTNGFDNDQVKILQGRKLINKQSEDTLLLKLQAGLYNSMQLDIIKNLADFINPDYLIDYKYKILDIIPSYNKSIYVIQFDGSEPSVYGIYKGKIFIDSKNHSIVNVEFELNKSGVRYADNFMVIKKPIGYIVKSQEAKYLVTYTLDYNNRLRLQYIRSEMNFKIRNRKKMFSSAYEVISELVITSVDATNTFRFSKTDISRRKDILFDQINAYDLNFWKQYSYIPIEKTLLEGIEEVGMLKK